MYRSLLITILLLLISNCEFQTNPLENKCSHLMSEDFMSMRYGTYWVYDYYLFNNHSISPPEIRKYEIIDISTSTINNQNYTVGHVSLFSSFNNFAPSPYSELFLCNDTGVYFAGFIFDDREVRIKPEMIYKFPAEIGDNWIVRNLSLDSNQDSLVVLSISQYTCVAKNVLVKTPVDTFETIVYGHSSKPVDDVLSYRHYFEYFCDGIGKVYMEVYSSFDSTLHYEDRGQIPLQIKMELKDYCIK